MAATRAQKIRLGLFAVSAAAALALVLIVFGGLRFWEHHDHYVIYFTDSVFGLSEGAGVSFAGIKAGTVDKIEIAPGDLRKVKVTIAVKRGLPIRADTTATLTMAGITGLKSIDLHGGEVTSPRLAQGGTITTGETTLDRFTREAKSMLDDSREIMAQAGRVAKNLATLTDPARFTGLDDILASARTTSTNLAATSVALRGLVGENRVALRQTMASVDHVADRAVVLVDQDLPRVIVGASSLIDDVRGLVRDNGTYLRSSMFDLRQASRSFKDLARDLRQRPSRLFFATAASERRMP